MDFTQKSGESMNKIALFFSTLALGALLLAACQPGPASTSPSGPTEKTLYVGPELVDCVGVAPQKCMQVKDTPDGEYQMFYDQIQGFTFEPGYTYELRVQVEQVPNPPADASSLKYTLIEVVEKTPVEGTSTPPATPGGADLSANPWELVSYRDSQGQITPALADATPTAEFKDGQVTGTAGCNSYFGSYTAQGDSLQVGPLGSTMMACDTPPGVMDQEQAYLAALQQAASYRIADGQLTISDAQGQDLLVYQATQPPALTGQAWQLTSYNNGTGGVVSVLDGTTVTAEFGPDGRIAGNAGCNSYSAGYTLTGEQISIEQPVATLMYCSDPAGVMDQEQAYLAALPNAATYAFVGSSLELRDANGALIASYQPLAGPSLQDAAWIMEAYNNGTGGVVGALPDVTVTAQFGGDGTLTGSAGCNSYTASYTADDTNLQIGPAASTRKLCPSPEGVMDQEAAYLAAISKAATYKITGDTLEIRDADGALLVRYAATQPPALTGQVWELSSYNNGQGGVTSALELASVTIEFQEDGTFNGNAGCNSYSGTYTTDGQQINLGQPIATLMFCGDPPGVMDQEQAYLAAIPNAATYAFVNGSLELRDASGALLASYQPLVSDPLQDTNWNLVAYNNGNQAVVTVLDGTSIDALFSSDGTLSGSSGCNTYSANFTVDGANLQIGPAASTRMFCSDPAGVMDQEQAYLAALENAATFKITGDKLEIRDADGALLAQYQASAGTSQAPSMLSPTSAESDPHLQALRNATYPSEFTQSGEAPLQDGVYQEQAAPGSASQVVVQYTPNTMLGTLSDGRPAAAVVLATNSGGSGTFYVLYLMDLSGEAPAALASTHLGDRVLINQVGLEGDHLSVDLVTQAPDEPFSSPTLNVVQTYTYQDGALTQGEPIVMGSISADEAPLLGVQWQWVKTVTPVEEIQVTQPASYTLRFLPNGKLLVQADCNSGSGTYTVDGTALSIGPVAMTLMACGPDSQDAEFLKELDAAALYFMDGPNLMIDLFADSGTMTFQRAK
jgi:heat shock protein HslJ